MSAADHETALREAIETLAGDDPRWDDPDPTLNQAYAAITALVGLLRQTEQERDEARRQAVGRKMQMHEYRQGNEFMKRERSRLQQEVERLKRGNQERENQERETPQSGVEVEAGEAWSCDCPKDKCNELPGCPAYARIHASTTNAERSPDSAPAPVCVRCVRLEEALRDLQRAALDVTQLADRHPDALMRTDAAWIVADVWMIRLRGELACARAALAAVGVPPDEQKDLGERQGRSCEGVEASERG